jgi:hypothetical protein
MGIDRVITLYADLTNYFTDSKSPELQHLRILKMGLLHLRAKSRGYSEDIQGSLVDFRDATIIALDEGMDLLDIQSAENLLAGLGFLRAKLPRPHFSAKEVRALKKDLRMMEYSPGIFRCHHCQKRASEVRLKMCGRCHEAWFCGPSCQQAAWPLHMLMCNPPKTAIVLRGVKEAMVRRKIAEETVFVAKSRGLQGFRSAAAVLCDPVTGTLFDSITNKDVIFDN